MNKKVDHFNFLTLFRAIASLLVVWDHLVGFWLDNHDTEWLPLTIVRRYFTTPSGIIQDFGFFGVVLFFLISGFIITHVAQREGRFDFILKRVFRIYPPLIASMIFIVIFYLSFSFLSGQETYLSKFTFIDILLNTTLINFFMTNQNVFLGVTWTLIIEMLFYIMVFTFLPIVKKNPRLTLLSFSTISLVTILFNDHVNTNFFHFAISISFLTYLVFGQIIYYFWSKRINLYEFIFFTLLNYYVTMQGIFKINTTFYEPNNSFQISFFYAYFIFIIGLLGNQYIKINKTVLFFSNISYSLYLLHDMIGSLMLVALTHFLNYSISLLITFTFIVLLSHFSFKYIEDPSKILIRKIKDNRFIRKPKTMLE